MDIVFEMTTNTKIITGELQQGGMQYVMVKCIFWLGDNCLHKPFWERK
jgi:hypothetical protein